ncbi:hypothetical protein ACEWY4_026293 [Coilia grayii]|uniref:C1q domain-containing protein n=1 Tax=Coilia grayii TaxID=363190 RepID=A0ABD1IUF2_9TELE
MIAVISLVVLLVSGCGAHIQCSQTELETENQLRELRGIVLELRGKMADTQKELQAVKAHNGVISEELADVKTRLAASETRMKDLVMMLNTAQEVKLTAVKNRLAATETEVMNLKKTIEKPKVAFSAGLTNSGYVVAPSRNAELNLIFTKLITNVGQAYSSTTGFFTAPVKGVYFFRFTVMDILNSRLMFIKMFKNGQQIVHLGEYDTDGHITYLSSGVTLQLEVGDVVNMRLPAGTRLYDDVGNHNIFSGFLLFAV